MCHMCHGVACMCAHVVPIQVPDRLLPSPITHLQSAVRPGRCASNSVWPRSVTSTPHRVRTTYGRIEAGAGIEDRSPQYHALQPPPTCDACGRAHASCIRIRSHATPRAPRPRVPLHTPHTAHRYSVAAMVQEAPLKSKKKYARGIVSGLLKSMCA